MSDVATDEDFRRLVRARIPDEAIPYIFRDGARVEPGLPAGSQLVRMYDQPVWQARECIFRNPEFDVVPEGAEIPVVDVFWDHPQHGLGHGERSRVDGVSEIAISHEVFSTLFWDGSEVRHDLPSDTRFRRMYEDEARQLIGLQFLSEEFEKPDEGDPVPRIDAQAENLWGINLADEEADNELLSSYTGGR